MPGEQLRILIAGEESLYRELLRRSLESEPDLLVVAEAAEADDAIMAAERAKADVVLLSAGLAGVDEDQPACLMKDRVPECSIIILADAQDQRLLTDGLVCGASGYLTTDCSVAELVDTVRGVARGDMLIPPAMLRPLLSDLIDRRHQHADAVLKLADLSPRERQVLALVARGRKTGEIAEELVISTETARTHVQNILTKLGVHSRLEAASFVIENSLLDHLEPRSAEVS